jgi:hypothetical protein|tara:strand:- start:586 stop:840 length:255 start_codon:yes stop_codon:yes gene_type:complete
MTIKPSQATVYVDDTLRTTGIKRPDLIIVCTYLVRTKRAKNAGEALRLLDSGEVNVAEIEELIIQSYQKEFKEPEHTMSEIEEN